VRLTGFSRVIPVTLVVVSTSRVRPPDHIFTAFGADRRKAQPLPGGTAWRCGEIVLKPVVHKAQEIWVSQTLASIDQPKLRFGRPLRSRDGRNLVAGWRAYRYLTGTAEPRPDETVLTAIVLHQATAELPKPAFLAQRDDVAAIADRIAWEEQELRLDETKGGRWFEVLAGARRPVRLPNQVVHGDLFGSVLFDGEAAPGVVDFTPYYRPGEWGAAVAAVDALTWGDAEAGLLHRWSHLPHWSQLLLRAILFRLAMNALHPRSTRASLDGLLRAAHEVSELL
jgi:uncharacterized protein (TIGR02569 family)